MTESHFLTPAGDLDSLLAIADLDSLEDLETLLMVVFARPAEVRVVEDRDAEPPDIEVILVGDEWASGTEISFPMTMVELVWLAAEAEYGMAPYTRDGNDSVEPLFQTEMNRDATIAALQTALGQVRLFNMLDN